VEIQTVKVERLYLQVADQLSRLIEGGNLPPGKRLPSERDLAESFGVSRPTIREAMIALEIAGLVEIRSGSGAYALQKSKTNAPVLVKDEGPGPLELLEARYHFESEAAALAAKRITADELTALVQAVHDMEEKDRLDHTREEEEADQRFHLIIAGACRNSAMQSTINWLWEIRNQAEISKFFHEKLRDRGSKPVIRDHVAILNALRKGNPEEARAAMQAHLKGVLDTVLDESDGYNPMETG